MPSGAPSASARATGERWVAGSACTAAARLCGASRDGALCLACARAGSDCAADPRDDVEDAGDTEDVDEDKDRDFRWPGPRRDRT
jgi:hypothetical protein